MKRTRLTILAFAKRPRLPIYAVMLAVAAAAYLMSIYIQRNPIPLPGPAVILGAASPIGVSR